MSSDDEGKKGRLQAFRAELAYLEAQRERILTKITELESTASMKPPADIETVRELTPTPSSLTVNNQSPPHE